MSLETQELRNGVMRKESSMNSQPSTLRNKMVLLDFGETFAPVARLEAIRILLVYACSHNIKLFQMNVQVLS